MSAVRSAPSPARELAAALREAASAGCELRIRGADVVISHLNRLPEATGAVIERRRQDGFLYDFIGGSDADDAAVEFLRKLGVEAVLVEDRWEAIAAVNEMSAAPFVGFDIESAALAQYAKPRPPVAINSDGSLSGVGARATTIPPAWTPTVRRSRRCSCIPVVGDASCSGVRRCG